MKRISVTTVEKMRRYIMSGEDNYFDTLAAFEETVKGEFKGNDKTKFGSAHHKIIETGVPAENYIAGINPSDQIRGAVAITLNELKDDPENKSAYTTWFTDQQLRAALKYRADHPGTSNEVPVSKIYKTDFGDIQVSGIVDIIEGLVCRDFKNTFRARDDREYTGSVQSKFYMDILECNRFFYDVCLIENFETLPQTRPDASIVINDPYEIEVRAYANMQRDLIEYLNITLGYVDRKNLWSYLKEAKEASLPF